MRAASMRPATGYHFGRPTREDRVYYALEKLAKRKPYTFASNAQIGHRAGLRLSQTAFYLRRLEHDSRIERCDLITFLNWHFRAGVPIEERELPARARVIILCARVPQMRQPWRGLGPRTPLEVRAANERVADYLLRLMGLTRKGIL